jgi:hypothetical protein
VVAHLLAHRLADNKGEKNNQLAECDEESNGFGGKSDGNEGGRRLMATRAMAMAMAMATGLVMVMVMRLVGDKEGNGEGGKGECDGDEGGG